jgi:hypothetical protein
MTEKDSIIRELFKKLNEFSSIHEEIVGQVAIASCSLERNVDELFGYVFNLKHEHWSILTLSIRSIQTKINILIQALRQEVCPIDARPREDFLSLLKRLGNFLEMRNSIIHGQIRPDMTAMLALMEDLISEGVDKTEFLTKIDRTLRESICVSRFDAKTGEIRERRYNVLDIEQRIREAKAIDRELFECKESIRSRFDWIGIKMPLSEVRKLESYGMD